MLRGERAESVKKARESRARIESTLEEERRKHLRVLENRHAKQLAEQRSSSEEKIRARLIELSGELSTDQDERNRIEHSLRTEHERQLKKLEVQLEGRRRQMIAKQKHQMLQRIQFQRDFIEAKLGIVVSSAVRLAEKKNKLAAIVEAKSEGGFKSMVKRSALKRKQQGAVLANDIAMKWRLKAKARNLGHLSRLGGRGAENEGADSWVHNDGKARGSSNSAAGFRADSAAADIVKERLEVIEDLLKSIAAKQGMLGSVQAGVVPMGNASHEMPGKANISFDMLFRQRSTAIEKLLGNIATREKEVESLLKQKEEQQDVPGRRERQRGYTPDLILDRLKGYAFASSPEVREYLGDQNDMITSSFSGSGESFAQKQQRRREEIEELKKAL